jgi:heterogeneous nuclear ribonucleoprotein L
MDGKKFNCQRLFNLLCIYGTIIKIKFLKTKDGSAMVQMGDRDSCDRVIRNLHGATCFGSRFSISMSKQSFLQDVINPHQLPDGSEGYANYIGSRNQRYTSPDAAAKNRPVPPTTALYFYNAPPNVSEDVLMEAVTDAGAVRPTKICIFPPKSDKSSRGLMQWHNVEDCIEALVLANHAPISNSTASRNPFILKLAFSQSALD